MSPVRRVRPHLLIHFLTSHTSVGAKQDLSERAEIDLAAPPQNHTFSLRCNRAKKNPPSHSDTARSCTLRCMPRNAISHTYCALRGHLHGTSARSCDIFIVSPCTRLVLLDDEVFWDILRNVDVMCMLISYRVPHFALHFA